MCDALWLVADIDFMAPLLVTISGASLACSTCRMWRSCTCACDFRCLAGVASATHAEVVFIACPVFIVLCWIRSFRYLAFTSVLGDIAFVLAMSESTTVHGRVRSGALAADPNGHLHLQSLCFGGASTTWTRRPSINPRSSFPRSPIFLVRLCSCTESAFSYVPMRCCLAAPAATHSTSSAGHAGAKRHAKPQGVHAVHLCELWVHHHLERLLRRLWLRAVGQGRPGNSTTCLGVSAFHLLTGNCACMAACCHQQPQWRVLPYGRESLAHAGPDILIPYRDVAGADAD